MYKSYLYEYSCLAESSVWRIAMHTAHAEKNASRKMTIRISHQRDLRIIFVNESGGYKASQG